MDYRGSGSCGVYLVAFVVSHITWGLVVLCVIGVLVWISGNLSDPPTRLNPPHPPPSHLPTTAHPNLRRGILQISGHNE